MTTKTMSQMIDAVIKEAKLQNNKDIRKMAKSCIQSYKRSRPNTPDKTIINQVALSILSR